MIKSAGIALAIVLFAASPCAAYSITPADGWLWKVDVTLDNIRALLNPALAPEIDAERHQEAVQMIVAGNAVAAQRAMNHVRVQNTIKDSITFQALEDLESTETALWNSYMLEYGISETPTEFPLPPHLSSVLDGEYRFTVTTTSGQPLGVYTALKLSDNTSIRSGEPSGEYGKTKFDWTYTVSELESIAGRHGYISQPEMYSACSTCQGI